MNPPPARNTKVMNRFDLTSRLVARLKNEEAVVGGIGNTNFDLWAAGHRPQNFYMLGSMGLAFPIALGVALAQPKRRVIALEGDGSLLDNSMIVYGAGLSDGNRHTHEDLPTMIVGRGGKHIGGGLKTGRRIVYRKETPMSNLFLTMMDRMGTKVEHFGDATGRLDGLDLA